MIKVAAISGLIVAGITITIFMAPGGPCDPIKNPKPPPFNSARGDKVVMTDPLEWIKEKKCGLFNPADSSKETQVSPSAESINPSIDSTGSKTKLKAAFSFANGSLRKSSKVEIRGNVSVEIKKDGTSSENLFDWLPIKVILKAGSQKVWEAEVTKGSGCREYFHNQYCTLVDYKYDPAWDGKKLYLYAYDKNGAFLAFHYEE